MPTVQRRSKAMREFCRPFFFIIYFICFNVLTNAYAAIITAKSCSSTDVQNAVNSATRGDTVTVPAGNCNWNNTVIIKKAITLQGEGSSATKISSTFQAAGKAGGYPFVQYVPTTSDKGYVFRMTQFQFDCANYSATFRVDNSDKTYGHSVRVDNNRILNGVRGEDGDASVQYEYRTARTLIFVGPIKGVVDNNYFTGQPTVRVLGTTRWITNQILTWDNGTDFAVFFEDNYFLHNDNYQQILVGSVGGAFVARYNTFDYSARGSSYFYTSDTHGAQPGPTYSANGGEIYGNKIIGTGIIGEFRGGIHKIFYNKVITSYSPRESITLWETYSPVYSKATTVYTCPAGSLYAGTKTCSVDGRSQNVEKSYFWNNRYGAESSSGNLIGYNVLLGGGVYPDPSETRAKALRANTDYWLHNPSCSGSSCMSGVGCGNTLPSSCTQGTGYWLTDQSCSTIPSGSYGPNPSTPLSGTLYRCEPTNTWKAYYTPYTYPHPLRSGETETIRAPKGFKLVN